MQSKKRIFSLLLLLIFHPVFAENNRVYVPIPGVSKKFNTEDTIQKLLMVKKIPIQKLENNNEDLKIENAVLMDFKTYAFKLNNASKKLYTFDNPFNSKKAFSQDESVLKASAQRNAVKQEYKIQIQRLASPDSFISDSLKKDKRLSAGQFSVKSDGQSIKIRFNGGTPAQFAKVFEEQASEILQIRTIHDSPNTLVLNIRSKNTGKKSALSFEGNLTPFFEAGLLKKQNASQKTFSIDLSQALSENNLPLLKEKNKIILKTGNQARLKIQGNDGIIKAKTILSYKIKRRILPKEATSSIQTNPNLEIFPLEPVQISNVSVFGASIVAFLKKKQKPKAVESNFTALITLEFNDGATKTLDYRSDGSFDEKMSLYAGKIIQSIRFENKNTDREFEIRDLRLKTLLNEGGIQPKNRISKAEDALFTLDGVPIKRDKNLIKDALAGVNLELIRPSKREITLKIDHDYDLIQKSIEDWVNLYNQNMEYLSILTKPDQDRRALHKKEKKNQKNGLFQTESSFISLRNTLRRYSGLSYPTGNDHITMLNQIGIYTKKPGSINTGSDTWEAVKMGLLNLDLDKLNESLKNNFQAVKNLFAYDTDGDLRMDTGVAFFINNALRFAIGQAGFIERKIAFNKNKMKENNKEIAQ